MIKNGGNGSFRVVFPLVRLVSLLWGFNSSGIHFLNFFNDPRIIREQRIAAYKGYRGGGVVRVVMKDIRAPKSQDRSRRESYKKEQKSFMAEENEASENQALVAEEVVPTEFALMAMSSSSSDNEVYDDSYCYKSYRKNIENLTTKISKLREELFNSESDLCNYKRGLSQVEARILQMNLKKSRKRDGIDSKLEKLVNSSKDLDQVLESQKSGKKKKGVGFDKYRDVPPPPVQVYSTPMPDLSWTSLLEFADNTVTNYTRPTPSVDVTNDVRSELDGNNLTVCEYGGTSSKAVSKPIINFVKESGYPNVIKINNIENSRKPTAKYAELYRNITQSSNVRSNNFGPLIIEDWDFEDGSDTESTPIESIRSTINQNREQPRGNQRNWNNLKSQQLGKDFVMQNKACYKCGSFENLKVNCNKNKWVNKGKNWSRVYYTQGNLTPKAILLKSGTKTIAPNRSFSTARTSLNVPTVRTKNPTVGLKVPTAKPTVVAAKGNKGKAVKASARWIWKPKQISGEGSNVNGVSGKPLDNIDDKGFWDSGCSRHMTGNISYLSDYEPYDGGYVSFGYGGGKITGKGTIKTGKLEFENVHFVKELKYNLFSVSQICDNKNCVLFTDSECIVLGRDFKLEDDRHVLLRTPRRCDNRGEFKNKEMDDFCSRKGIKREFSNARTPQQNGVAERRNKTVIEAARTMLADAKLHVTFWAEAVNTACYIQNSVQFDAKGDEGFFVGYSLNSKAFRVYNKRTKHIEENLHINFLESKVIDKAGGPNWLFDIESLIKFMNYIPVVGAGTSYSNISGTKEDVKQAEKEKESPLRYIALPNWFHEAQMITTNDAAKKSGGILIDSPQKEQEEVHTDKDDSEQVEHEVNEEVPESSGISFPTASSKDLSKLTSTPTVETVVPTVSTHVSTASENIFTIDPSKPPSTPTVETTVPTVSTPILTIIKSRGGLRYLQPPSISNVVSSENRVEDFFGDSTYATRLNEVEADLSNMETTIQVSPTPTLRIYKDHLKNQIIGPVDSPV
ncbi:ribonuclease H-like domain-containing protein, partial [Tanacetum coccineum]